MSETLKREYCSVCQTETDYVLKKVQTTRSIRYRENKYRITAACCSVCGGSMNIPGMKEINNAEIDRQYRRREGIIQQKDIIKLMDKYKLGKGPMSLALGFAPGTIGRYMRGQIPSRDYSDIMREALNSREYMKQLLLKNKGRLTKPAFERAMQEASITPGRKKRTPL